LVDGTTYIPPIVVIAVVYAATRGYASVVREYDSWRQNNPQAAEGLDTAIAVAIGGAVLFGLGALAWIALSNTDAEAWKILGNLSLVIGLVGGVGGGIAWYRRVNQPTSRSQVGPESGVVTVFTGMRITGRPSPGSAMSSWRVDTIDESKVVLKATAGTETYQMTRPVFEAAVASGALTVTR
jgi:hypothetical protein